MVGNVFAQSPLSNALEQGRAHRAERAQSRGIVQPPEQAAPLTFESISNQNRVPVNVLMSLAEANGLEGDAALSFANQEAQRLGPRLQAGESITDAVGAAYGQVAPPEAISAMLERAKAIGAEKYPDQFAPQGGGVAVADGADPFDGEGAGALLARRGQQFAAGAVDVAASTPEAIALAANSLADFVTGGNRTTAADLRKERDALINGAPTENPSARIAEIDADLARPDRWSDESINNTNRASVADDPVFALGDALRGASENLFGKADERDQSFWGKLANGAGNMAGFIVAGMLGGAGSGGAAGSLLVGGGAGSAMTSSQLYKEAIASGASEETAMSASRWGAAIGSTEILPIFHILKVLPKSVRSKITSAIAGRVATIAASAGEEGVQEYLSQIAQNATAKNLYDPNRDYTDGAAEAALIGAILGGGMGVPGAIRGAPSNEDGAPDAPAPNGGTPADVGPDTGPMPLRPDQRTDVGMVLRPDQMVTPPQNPAPAPTGPLGRAAEAGPAPLTTEFDHGQMVNITTTAGMNENAQFIQETPAGVMVRGEDGSTMEIPREEIESGFARLGPVVPDAAPVVPQPNASDSAPVQEVAQSAPEAAPEATPPAQAPQADTGPVTMQQEVFPAKVPNSNTDALMPDMAVAQERAATGQPSLGQLAEGVAERNSLGTIASAAADQISEPQTGASSAPDAAQMTVEEARTRIEYLNSQGRTNGWNKKLVALKREAESIVSADVASSEEVAVAPEEVQAPSEAKAETKRDGNPFSSEATAKRALSNRRLNPADFDILPRSGGFVAAPVGRSKPKIQSFEQFASENGAGRSAGEAGMHVRGNASDTAWNRALAQADAKAEDLSTRRKELRKDYDALVAKGQITAPTPIQKIEEKAKGHPDNASVKAAKRVLAKRKAKAETKRDGSPFATEKAAKQALKNRRLKPEGFDIVPRDGGFVAVAHAGEAEATPKAAQPDIKPAPMSDKAPVSDTTKAEKADTPTKEVEKAAAEANPNPTDAQKEAGNYKLGHVNLHGMDISIENAKGSERSGVDSDGERWSVTMPAAYGYIKRTEGADGDHVDVYIGGNPESDVVVVVDQLDLATGKFDEHKVILGAKDHDAALAIYEGGFSDGKGSERIGGSTEMGVDTFKAWLETGDQTKPMATPEAQGKAIFDRLEASQTRENAEHAAVKALGEEQQVGGSSGNGDRSSSPKKPTKTEKPAKKVEDFGEVLHGAAKHYAAAYGEKMKVAGEQDTKEVPLSKSWPVPDYQKLIDEGADPWAVAFARAARDEIPTKPRGRYARGRLANWVKQVETLRQFSEDVMSGKIPKDKVEHGLMVRGAALQGIGNRVDLYLAVGHEKSLAGVTLNEGRYGVYDGVEHNPPLVMWTVSRAAKKTAFGNMPYQLAKGATKEEAIAAFKKNIASIETQPKASKQVRFSVYSYRHRKGFVVGKKIGRQHVDLAKFDTKEEARKYLADNEAELVKKLEAFKSIPNERKESNSPRVGEDHRGGEDATPEMFAEAFGFRGVQFGNYVEGPKRQADLNRAYDALMDMAGVLNIPSKAISLNGTLGLAFGARGKGGKLAAAAHFESDSIVINLTKKEGAGSLAHEWWHAADNYFSRIRKQPSGFLSETPYKTKGRDTDAELRQEIADAFKAVRDAIGKTDMAKRSAELDKRRTKGYWATGRELSARAFEGFIISKLADNGLANDYLANITSEGVWNAEDALTGHEDAQSYPYPTEAEQKAITEAYDALFRTVETKETPTGVAMLSRGEPVTVLTGKEFGKGLNIRQLQKAARDWYRENLSGTHVTMDQTGWDIQFTNASAKKTTFTPHAELLRIIPALKEILAKGRVVETEDYKGTKKDFRAVHKIAATVEVGGKVQDVIVTVREHKNGHFQYTLSRDNSAGARFSKSITNHPERVGDKPKAPDGIWDHAGTLNLYLDEQNFKSRAKAWAEQPYSLITRPEFQAKAEEVKLDLIEQLQKVGIANKIKVKVAEHIFALTPSGVTVKANGFQFGNIIAIATRGSGLTKDVMNHESIHALKSPDLWGGRKYGLFSQQEWRALVAHARKDKARMANVRRRYADLNSAKQVEEAIADIYAEWADANIQHPAKIEQILQKMQDFFEAIGNALRGNGFRSANDVFRSVAEGEIGARQDMVAQQDAAAGGIMLSKQDMEEITPETEAQENARYSRGLDGKIQAFKEAGPKGWKRAKQIARGMKDGDTLTQLMGGDKSSILGFVPGRNLFTELGKDMPSAQKYIGIKQEMDAVRSEWHATTDKVAKKWRKVMSKRSKTNKRLMDLMHNSTLAQVDPSKPFESALTDMDKAILAKGNGKNKAAYETAMEKNTLDRQRRLDYKALKAEYDALPSGFQRIYEEVRDTYAEMDKEFDKALIANIEKAMAVTIKGYESRHKAELERITDEGMTGAERAEAVAKADKTLATARQKARWGHRARVIALRQQFESNRLMGPYFPLGRFGQFAVTVRDAKTGKVKNFSRFEKAIDQTEFAATMRKDKTNKVEVGVIEEQKLKEQVDTKFVADIEHILSDSGVSQDVMDSVWQKWLQDYVPELSIRKSNIHRKGLPGYSADAFRVFGRHVMHGAHQLARLKYGLDLTQALDDAKPEARASKDPVRAGLVLEEMRRRHQFTMNPTGAAWATTVSSITFTWYLAMTPAAALVNISQTTVIGIPVLAAYYDGKRKGSGTAKAAFEISKASKDFVKGYGTADRNNNLTKDESAAMKEAYRRSTIDATNAHDIAGVAESGVKYSDRRSKIMGVLSFAFHHAERFNREVTFLAAYRMARKKGRTHEEAIDVGSDLTWKTHFDYQNTSRPRVMQGDVAKVLLTFRNYQANMIWRLFRDTHQMLKGESKADKKEALRQLGGITAMMALHAGVRGTWLFGISMMIAGMIWDEPEEELKKGAVDMLGPVGASLVLNGVLGTVLGTDVSERIGMPDLIFRSSNRLLDGRDEYNYWLTQSLGASIGLVERTFRGVNMMFDGHVWRGVETLAPKFVRDQMKAQRFYEEGALTYRGDPLMDEVSVLDQMKQAIGFTPAALAERYQTNTWMKNREKRITDARREIHKEAGDMIMDGERMTPEILAQISEFNSANPTYPITRQSLSRSISSRRRASANNEYGATINRSLNNTIRSEAAPLISQ